MNQFDSLWLINLSICKIKIRTVLGLQLVFFLWTYPFARHHNHELMTQIFSHFADILFQSILQMRNTTSKNRAVSEMISKMFLFFVSKGVQEAIEDIGLSQPYITTKSLTGQCNTRSAATCFVRVKPENGLKNVEVRILKVESRNCMYVHWLFKRSGCLNVLCERSSKVIELDEGIRVGRCCCSAALNLMHGKPGKDHRKQIFQGVLMMLCQFY